MIVMNRLELIVAKLPVVRLLDRFSRSVYKFMTRLMVIKTEVGWKLSSVMHKDERYDFTGQSLM